MSDVEKYVFDEVCGGLASIDVDTAADIYVLSFYVDESAHENCHPILRVGFNTQSRVETCRAEIGGQADADELKWNFAFWLQNTLLSFGEPGTEGQRLLEDMLTRKKLWYSDKDEDADFDACMQKADAIGQCFAAMCVRVAQELHACGIIEQRFGRRIPIIVHELEYFDQIASRTAAANPAGLANEFVDWINRMYDRPA